MSDVKALRLMIAMHARLKIKKHPYWILPHKITLTCQKIKVSCQLPRIHPRLSLLKNSFKRSQNKHSLPKSLLMCKRMCAQTVTHYTTKILIGRSRLWRTNPAKVRMEELPFNDTTLTSAYVVYETRVLVPYWMLIHAGMERTRNRNSSGTRAQSTLLHRSIFERKRRR